MAKNPLDHVHRQELDQQTQVEKISIDVPLLLNKKDLLLKRMDGEATSRNKNGMHKSGLAGP